jgi:hypothetical protein
LDSFRDIDIEVYRMCSKVTEEKNRKSSRKLVFKKESFGETMLLEFSSSRNGVSGNKKV